MLEDLEAQSDWSGEGVAVHDNQIQRAEENANYYGYYEHVSQGVV